MNRTYLLSIFRSEVFFQVVVHVLVFLFYAIDRRHNTITGAQVAFYLHYAAAAALISYVLLPRLAYRGRAWAFSGALLAVLAAVIFVEEAIMEAIFYPKRAEDFGGLFYTLGGVLPVIVVLVGSKLGWDAFRKQREVEQLRATAQESELQFLKSQINPHFLFNNLNNLYAYAVEASPRTPQLILELAGLLRYMLYECQAARVPLEREVAQLSNYVQLSELQVESRGSVQFREELAYQGYEIAPLLLIVFVENAFKHSMATQSEDITIDISLDWEREGVLRFTCVNSYRRHEEEPQLDYGIGLTNVRKRLALLYPEAHRLTITDSERSYQVELLLHLDRATSPVAATPQLAAI